MGKEEDKIERLIRGLIKLPANRRCMNCNCLGPQYVCTTFWTFVCTNCSGVHREFTHRVKSVSMAKFTMEEVNSLQAGGNEKAREIYFNTWNPQHNFPPDNSNIHKLRDFIKQVYVERRYSGDNNPVLLPRLRNSEKDESYSGRQDTYRESKRASGRYATEEVRSPGYSNERRNRYSMDEVRSPSYGYGYPRESSGRYLSNNETRSPGSYSSRGIGEGRYQVDDARIAGRSATQMFTTEDIKLRSRDVNCPPPVHARNLRDVLGEKSVSMRVGDRDQPKRSFYAATNAKVGEYDGQNSPRHSGNLSKTAHRRSISAYVQNQKPATASNESIKPKGGSEGSLVDFGLFPPPPSDATNSTSSETPVNKENLNKAPLKNTLEFLLFELSTPTPTPTPSTDHNAPLPSNALTSNHVPSHSNSNHSNDPSNLQLALASAQECTNIPTPSAAVYNNSDSMFNTSTTVTPQSSRHVEKPNVVATPQMVPDFLGADSVSSASASTAPQTSHLQQTQATNLNLFPSTAAYTNSNSTLNTSTTSMPTPQSSRHVEKPNVVATPQMVPDFFGDYGVSDSFSASAAPQTGRVHEIANNQATNLNLFPASSGGVAFDNSTAQETKPPVIEVQPSPGVAKSSGRPELPQDLFASPYPSISVSAPAWQMSPMGFNMPQYYQNTSMQTAPLSHVTKSVNPFDTTDDAPQQPFTMNPSMPSVPTPSSIQHTQSHFQGFPSSQLPSYQPQPGAGAYMGQYSFSNIPPSSQQETVGFSLHLNQQLPYQYTPPADPRSFPTGGGNPFG